MTPLRSRVKESLVGWRKPICRTPTGLADGLARQGSGRRYAASAPRFAPGGEEQATVLGPPIPWICRELGEGRQPSEALAAGERRARAVARCNGTCTVLQRSLRATHPGASGLGPDPQQLSRAQQRGQHRGLDRRQPALPELDATAGHELDRAREVGLVADEQDLAEPGGELDRVEVATAQRLADLDLRAERFAGDARALRRRAPWGSRGSGRSVRRAPPEQPRRRAPAACPSRSGGARRRPRPRPRPRRVAAARSRFGSSHGAATTASAAAPLAMIGGWFTCTSTASTRCSTAPARSRQWPPGRRSSGCRRWGSPTTG